MKMRFIATLGVALAAFSHTASAATVVGGSGPLTAGYAKQIETWLQATPLYDGGIQLTNIFTSGNGKTSADFHAAADGKGPTITILSVVGNNGVSGLIGGFNPQSWDSIKGFNFSFDVADRTAFTFNLTTSVLLPQSPGGDFEGGFLQTYNVDYVGPTFGGGFDLYSNSDLQSGYSNAFSYGNGCGSSCSGQANLLGGFGQTDFTISSLDVFTITETTAVAAIPELSTWAMMILGFAGIGTMAYRRRKSATLAA